MTEPLDRLTAALAALAGLYRLDPEQGQGGMVADARPPVGGGGRLWVETRLRPACRRR